MANDRPQNLLQVLTGAAGKGLEAVGTAKAEEKRRAVPEALSIFNAMLMAEKEQEDRALRKIERKEANINVKIKGLQLQKVMELQKLGFDNPLQLEEALRGIKDEAELEHTKNLMEMVEEETGITTIPSGLKVPRQPKTEKPPFTPYQEYQQSRTRKKESRQESIETADRAWQTISGDLGDILGIEGEDPDFEIKNIADIDHALSLLQSAKDVPYALHPELHEVAVQLQKLRESYQSPDATPEEQSDYERLLKKFGNQ